MPKTEYPGCAGKVVDTISASTQEPYLHVITIVFRDKTALSFSLLPGLWLEGDLVDLKDGSVDIIRRYADQRLGS